MAFSPDGKQIASGSKDGTVRIWEMQTGIEVKCLDAEKGHVEEIAYSPDGNLLVARIGFGGKRIHSWDVRTWQRVGMIEGVGDVDAIAEGGRGFPFIAISGAVETTIVSFAEREEVGWFPIPFHLVTTHRSGRIWYAAEYDTLYAFALEPG